MKNIKLRYILVGIIIGLVISISCKFTNETNAASTIYTESHNNPENYLKPSKLFIEATNKVKDSVVYVYTEKTIKYAKPFYNDHMRDFFGDEFFRRFFGDQYGEHRQSQPKEQEYKQQGLGSGFIISKDGYVITNNHVIDGADKIKIKLSNKKEYEAKVIGSDKKTDIAVLKIDADHLPFVKLGDSDKLQVGEWIIAIGNPFGFMRTVTTGIVSAKGRSEVMGLSSYQNFIQIDAAINPGNSGGPMINLNGDVVGVNTAIYSRSGGNMGIGFAVPINMVKKVISDLINNGKVIRGYLGVIIQDLNQELAKKFDYENLTGVLVTQIMKGSPADKAGLKHDDIILEFNNKKINNTNQLRNTVANTEIDKTVNIIVLRDGKKKTLYVKIKAQPKNFGKGIPAGSSYSSDWFGVSVEKLNSELAKKYGYGSDAEGIVITNVENNSVADKNGLKEGDIILEIERKPIQSIDNFNNVIEKLKDTDDILFRIKRGYSVIYFVVKNDE